MSNPKVRKGGFYREVERARRRLLLTLVIFVAALAAPLSFVFFLAYQNVYQDNLGNYQQLAEQVVGEVEKQISELSAIEMKRPFEHYSYFNVSSDSSLPQSLQRSPLAQGDMLDLYPGLVGFFQIDADNQLTTPYLPETSEAKLPQKNDSELLGRFNTLVNVLSETEEKSNVLGAERNSAQSPGSQLRQYAGKNAYPGDYNISPQVKLKRKLADNWESLDGQKANAYFKRGQSSLSGAKGSLSGRTKKQAGYYSKSYNNIRQQVVVPQQQEALEEVQKWVGEEGSGRRVRQIKDITLESFESVIDPLQVVIIDEALVIFRRVWTEKKPYMQGLVVDERVFFGGLFRNIGVVNSQQLLEIKILSASEERFVWGGRKGRQGIELVERMLPAPFDGFKMRVMGINTQMLSAGAEVLNLVLIGVIGVVLVAVVVIYRIGRRELGLAKRQLDFVSAVSHELKTPLASIRMFAEMLDAGWVADEAKKKDYYGSILSEGERLSRLIDNVLRYSAMEHGIAEDEVGEVGVAEIAQIFQKKRLIVEDKEFEFNVYLPAELESVVIFSNLDELEQVIINLVDNALKYGRGEDCNRLDIGFEQNGKQLRILVRDWGKGIGSSQLEKIFERFYRGEDEATRESTGTGIGLALVREMIVRHGGKIWAESADPGLRFVLELQIESQ